jgi:hypothetical protein
VACGFRHAVGLVGGRHLADEGQAQAAPGVCPAPGLGQAIRLAVVGYCGVEGRV